MYQNVRKRLHTNLENKSPHILDIIRRYKIGIKYVISGGISALVALILLYSLTDFFKVWYLISVVLGNVAGLFTNFCLQKYWTFRDPSSDRMQKQFMLFVTVAVIHLILNTTLMFFLVSVVGLWYMLAQVIVLGTLAIGSFLFHKKFTFKEVRKIKQTKHHLSE